MRIHHVAMETRPEDVEACARFYELLGFARVERPESLRDRGIWLEHGGQQIHLQRDEDVTVPKRSHFALVADDYEATLATLREGGFEPDEREQHWGSPRVFVHDPAGHVVEVMEFPPG
jgi:catechol 2,3-dioxygenase-like lactoylglutathione lyase family enzyme